MGLLKEFKEFALRGNVMDMAVGVIIGAAFQKIVNSLVSDLLMPPLGKAMSIGGQAISIKDWYFRLFTEEQEKLLPANYTLADIQKANLPMITYGAFVSTVLDFVILAFCVFLMIKLMNMARQRFEKQKEEMPAALTTSEKLLTEIRDAVQAKSS